jgi:F0F1-type ATP synthase assembly protein I
MSKTETVYDSTDIQLRALGDMVTGKLTLDDLAKPEIVQLIIERHVISLTDLKTVKSEVAELRTTVTQLTEEREKLRIDLAKSEQRQSILLLEIPIGVLSGFAINMLTTNFASGLGWALLIISLIMLLFLRFPQLRASIRKENKNGE